MYLLYLYKICHKFNKMLQYTIISISTSWCLKTAVIRKAFIEPDFVKYRA